LVHISELSNRYIKEPGVAVKVGQIVKVKVLSADVKTKRIALSMKALLEVAPKVHSRNPQPAKPAEKPQMSVEQKLSMLSAKWKAR
jgi:uncharacterized protein